MYYSLSYIGHLLVGMVVCRTILGEVAFSWSIFVIDTTNAGVCRDRIVTSHLARRAGLNCDNTTAGSAY